MKVKAIPQAGSQQASGIAFIDSLFLSNVNSAVRNRQLTIPI